MKQRSRNCWSALLTLVLFASTMPMSALPALADDGVSYIDANGAERTCASATAVTTGDTTWGAVDENAHWYVVNDAVTIEDRVTVSGDVHLILADGASLTLDEGIQVQDDDRNANTSSKNGLTIYAQSSDSKMGTLTATGYSYDAGIGSDEGGIGGRIIINGGNVMATGEGTGAAIGGGGERGAGGEITINGGTVTATGGQWGAGIGGGEGGDGGTITITGGDVTATAESGAGIGGGGVASQWTGRTGGVITIENGKVTAKSNKGAGIGSGEGGTGVTITISNGSVVAESSGAAAIGSGARGYGNNIKINGGTVKATSAGGAGIGGANGNPGGSGGTITINDGDVTASGGAGGAGIGGGGGSGEGVSGGAGGTITITGGTVNATGSKMDSGLGVGAGIGGGAGGQMGNGGNGGVITITGGNVTATSGNFNGADIGGGRGGDWLVPGTVAETNKIDIAPGVSVKNSSGNAAVIGPHHGVDTSKWASESDGHWHPCGIDGCNNTEHQSPKVAHSFETMSDAENHWQECVQCGYKKDEAEHSWAETLGKDETNHWTAMCTTCGYKKDATAHTWSVEWQKDENKHWKVCSGCEAVSAEAVHTAAPATCGNMQTCAECGQAMGVLEHAYGDLIPLQEATIISTGMKAHYQCSRCDAYFDENRVPTTLEALTIPKIEIDDGGGTVTPSYTLTFDTNGGDALPAVKAKRGTAIDLSDYTPTREGYLFDGWYADEALNTPISSVTLSENTTIYAGWAEIPTPPDLPFSDVNDSDWFYEPVAWAYGEGLMTGTSATTFEPNTTTSRGMIVSVFYRLEGNPDLSDEMLGYPYEDVPGDAWYAMPVYWARMNGIVAGYSDSHFGPNDAITREQLAAILYNYAEWKGDDVSARATLDQYSDTTQISDWASDVVSWAVAEGLLNGISEDVLQPQGLTTRAQVAAILERFLSE